MTSDNVLEITGLNVEFATERGAIKALRDVDLEIPQGSIVGVVGESGCGKSTMINAIIGLLAHNASVKSGSIIFEGTDLLEQLAPWLPADTARVLVLGPFFDGGLAFLRALREALPKAELVVGLDQDSVEISNPQVAPAGTRFVDS